MKKDYPKAFENYQKVLSVAPTGFKSENLFNNLSVTNLKVQTLKLISSSPYKTKPILRSNIIKLPNKRNSINITQL